MKFGRIFTFLLIGYFLWCTYLILESGFFSMASADGPFILLRQTEPANIEQEESSPATKQSEEPIEKPPAITRQASFNIDNSTEQTFIIGADDPNTEDPEIETNFKLQIQLTNKGAGIKKVTFSNGQGKGFDDRNPKEPKPYVLLSPVKSADGSEQYSMESGAFSLPQYNVQLPLNRLNWECLGVEIAPNGCEKASFLADIKDADSNAPVLRVTKVFDILPDTYVIHCHLSVENLSADEQDVQFDLNGTVGISREDVRSDMRKAIAAFIENSEGIRTSQFDINKLRPLYTGYVVNHLDLLDPERRWWRFWETPQNRKDQASKKMAEAKKQIESTNFDTGRSALLWVATVNKYFAAIAVPVPAHGKSKADWFVNKHVRYYDPDLNNIESLSAAQIEDLLSKQPDGDETIGTDFAVKKLSLAPAGTDLSRVDYKKEIYHGPKDKPFFDTNPEYKRLGFIYTIDFPACCICPAAIIRPLAFFIMWLMNVFYSGIPNYGVVIIILVFIVRLILHPITKAGQVRMNRFTKVLSSPEVREIKKKYAKNQMEAQKRITEFYKSRGVSPADAMFGMLPMLVQMPLWIALWSAVNASINLRGAPFLPVWITDLSVPDAVVSWPTVTIPLLGWKVSSLNLLPILMGVAFYLQQKTMPQQAAATSEQQQQQKIMKWMMLLMFPILLYNAPSGVNLYIMASTFAGAIEQYVIRKHIREKEQAESRGLVEVTSKTGGKVKKKKSKPFFKF
jgi:YidC/Oxa1 family membrane protein insertase